MQVLIGKDKYVDLNHCEQFANGKDGYLYKDGNMVIKICHSKYMTYGKFEDYKMVVGEFEEKKDDFSKKHIILPDEIVYDPKKKIKQLAVTPLFGYTQQYKIERLDGISSLKIGAFIDSTEIIHEEIHELFSRNYIAINDSNPKNLLVTDNGEIFLIDHDRNITPSSMITHNGIVYIEDVFSHNESMFARMINKALIMEIFRGIEMNDSNMRKKTTLMQEGNINNTSVERLYSALMEYDTVFDYANDKAKELNLKKS